MVRRKRQGAWRVHSHTRIFGLSGEYINKHELYMLASIIESLLTSQPVKIRAKHRVFRSYVYTADLIRLCMAIALLPGANETFDTAGHPIVEIEELARLAAATLGGARRQYRTCPRRKPPR